MTDQLPAPTSTASLPDSPQENSPEAQLLATNPQSLNELFARDPLSLTIEERSAIVAALRADRQRFAEAEAQGKPAPRKKAIKEKPKVELSLDDLLGSPQS